MEVDGAPGELPPVIGEFEALLRARPAMWA